MPLICLSGYKGSGKDTIANYLIDNYRAVRVAFADPLKDMVAEEFNFPRHWLDDPKYKESSLDNYPVMAKDDFSKYVNNFMIREFRTKKGDRPDTKYIRISDGNIQTFLDKEWENLYWNPRACAILKGSTNRSVNPNYWVNKAFEQIQEELVGNRTVVLTDLRYKSEMEELKNRFGKNVFFVRIDRFEHSTSNDPSERDLDDAIFDFYLDNTGTLEQTFVNLESILNMLPN